MNIILKRNLLTAIFIFSFFFGSVNISIGSVHASVQYTFYASPTGSGNSCTFSTPCSLTSVRDLVRTVNTNMTGDVIVYLLDGTYNLTSTFQLNENSTIHDSGTNGYNIIYQAYPGAKPIISGGQTIGSWQLYDSVKNIYRSNVGTSFSGTMQLYVNGVRAVRARGELNPTGFTKTSTGFTTTNPAYSNMSTWRNVNKIEIVNYQKWKFLECPISSVTGSSITMQDPCWTNAQANSPVFGSVTWIENAFELLSSPGMWYFDATDGYMYYIPRQNENMSTANVIAPVLQTLVSGIGTLATPLHNVQFNGLGFQYATWLTPGTSQGFVDYQASYHFETIGGTMTDVKVPGNVNFNKANNIVIQGNNFSKLGGSGLVFENGSQNNTVVGNGFWDISSNAIHIGEIDNYDTSDTRLQTTDNTVKDNYITNVANQYQSSIGIYGGYNKNLQLLHNKLDNLPYSGISVGWGWGAVPTNYYSQSNTISYNLVSNDMGVLVDGGAIYTNGYQPNSVMSNNYVYNQYNSYGSLYLDAGVDNYNVNNNVVKTAPYWLLVQGCCGIPAKNNTIINNYVDGSPIYGTGQTVNGNSLSNTTVVTNGNWPAVAVSIMNNAGLEPQYHYLQHFFSNTIEAEDYNPGGEGVGYHDLTTGNSGGAYRSDDVDIFTCSTCSNGNVVGYTQTGEWLAYDVNVATSDSYNFTFTVSTANTTSSLQLLVDGVAVGTAALPNTGGFSTYQDVILPNISLSQGEHTFKLVSTGGFQIDKFTYIAGTTVNNTSSSITYSTGWNNSANRGLGDYNNDAQYTSGAGNWASFTFTGTKINYITEKYSDEGNVDVYIDGTLDQTVNCNNNTRLVQQAVYSKTWATSGTHTIKIVKNSGTYMLLDAFKYYN